MRQAVDMTQDIEEVINQIENISIAFSLEEVQAERFVRRIDVVHDTGIPVFWADDVLKQIAHLYGQEPFPLLGSETYDFLGPDGKSINKHHFRTSPSRRWVEPIGRSTAMPVFQLSSNVPEITKHRFYEALNRQKTPTLESELPMHTYVFLHPSQQTLDSWKNKERHTDPVIAHLENTYDRPFWRTEKNNYLTG